MLGPTYHVVPREGSSTDASSFESSSSVLPVVADPPESTSGRGSVATPKQNNGTALRNGFASVMDSHAGAVDGAFERRPDAPSTSHLNSNGHAPETHVKELFVSSRELYPLDAIGGVVLRLLFVGGPDLRFFLCDLGNPTFLELVSVCTQMFGVPILADPRRSAR